MSNAIHLTNKTAISLRKNAVRMKTVYFVCAAVLSIAMAAAAVILGIKWLPAAPFILAITIMMDALIIIHGRSVYLSMIGQAICTEAAAREIRVGTSEIARRERALTDLMQIQADVGMAQEKKGETQKNQQSAGSGQNVIALNALQFRQEEAAADMEQTTEDSMPRRRRRSEGARQE